MKMENTLVSVIIPTYKRSDCICNTIDSVLNQTYSNIEIIVVDDNGRGSVEQQETESLLSEYIKTNKIVYVVHDVNKNGSAARNTGFRISSGEFINFLDDDDVFHPKKIEKQLDLLRKADAKYGAIYCNSKIKRIQNFTGKQVVYETRFSKEGDLCKEYLLDEVRFNTSTILFRRSVIEELNGFDESFVRHQDYELMVRFFMNNLILCSGLDFLSEYDTTQIRTYNHNPRKDFAVKEKFLSTFHDFFEKKGILLDVEHHFWCDCMLNCLYVADYRLFKDAFFKSFRARGFSVREIIRVFKCFFVGLMK